MLKTLLLLSTLFVRQDVPTDIPKAQFPAKAVCVVCEASGSGHGEEKPAAGVMFKGKAYYFCNVKEVAEFKKDPSAYLPPVLPRPIPEFDIKDLGGKQWNHEAMKDKVVLVDFWATWCGPCIADMPKIQKLVQAHAKNEKFVLLSVSVDQQLSAVQKFIKTKPFGNPVLHDSGGTYTKWGVKFIPAYFLLKDGQIISQWTGPQKKDVLEKAVENALK